MRQDRVTAMARHLRTFYVPGAPTTPWHLASLAEQDAWRAEAEHLMALATDTWRRAPLRVATRLLHRLIGPPEAPTLGVAASPGGWPRRSWFTRWKGRQSA
jgi:hypothetical protein